MAVIRASLHSPHHAFAPDPGPREATFISYREMQANEKASPSGFISVIYYTHLFCTFFFLFDSLNLKFREDCHV